MIIELKISEVDCFAYRFESDVNKNDIDWLINDLITVSKYNTRINIYIEAVGINANSFGLLWNQIKGKILQHYQVRSKIQKIGVIAAKTAIVKKGTYIMQNIQEHFFEIKDRNNAIHWLIQGS